ncbi:lipopolysaccharide biosynthesis protein [Chloroflexota bacterium]
MGLFLFLPRAQPAYRLRFTINLRIIKEIISFSFANYIAEVFWGAATLILPLMVVNLLGAELNAYFYIAWTIASVLTMIVGATSMSLFAEGSYEEERLGLNIWRSLKMIYLIIVPAVVLILVIAPKLLLLFGGSYSDNATTLLRILAISALPLATNNVYLATKRIEKKLRVLIGLTALAATLTLGMSYLLLPRMGITGVGIAWLISQGVIALVVAASWLKTGRKLRRVSTIVFPREES